MKLNYSISEFIIILLLLVTPISAYGTTNTPPQDQLLDEELLNLSLAELSNIQITIASKTVESILEAPSSVTVFTKNQIKQMGIGNIYDLLNYVPGFQSTRSVDLADESLLHVRGIANIDGHVLILLNGHRLNETSFGRASLYNRYLSSKNVKQVEIIRGPGSALYGSNAFLGVVNIITDKDSNEAGVTVGQHGHIGGYLNLNNQINSSLSASLSLDFRGNDGQNYTMSNGQLTDDKSQDLNIYSQLQYNDWSLDFAYMQHDDENFITFNAVADPGITWSKTSSLLIALANEWEYSKHLTINSNLSFTRHWIEFTGLLKEASPPGQDVDLYAGPYSQSSSYEFTTEAIYKMDSSDELVTGLTLRHEGVDYLGAYTNYLTADNYQISPSNTNYLGEIQGFKDIGQLDSREEYMDVIGVHGQYKTHLTDDLTSYIGIRYDQYSDIGDTINPRFGVIYNPMDETTFKILYGTAFRAPTNQELFTDSPRSVGNIQLKPERVQTLEFVTIHERKTATVEGVLFYNKLKDIIDVEIGGASDGRNTWSNQGDEEITGLELSLTLEPSQNSSLILTHTHIFSGLDVGTYSDFSSFFLNYTKGPWNGNLNGYIRFQPSGDLAAQTDNYAILNAKGSYQFDNDTILFTNINNIFDTNYYTYEPKLTSFNNAVPNRGTTVTIGLERSW
ncbi:MAG: TonB-dependent receptor [Magnetococcales bacterium]|nr:TonB-dependent receptor [Magnetococcales bacterium]